MNPSLQMNVGVSFDDMSPSLSWGSQEISEKIQDVEKNEYRVVCVDQSHIELSI